jgi:hypothetical protein
MKRKQLLLILINLVLVSGIIIIVLSISHSKAVDKSHNDLKNDLSYYATKAQEFYWRPSALGGGNRNFSGITLSRLSMVSSNAAGRFFIVGTPTKDEIVIGGIGTITAGKDSTQVQVIVNGQNTTYQIIH